MSLYQFLTKPLAGVLLCDVKRITLFWEDIGESHFNEDLNSVLIEGLG